MCSLYWNGKDRNKTKIVDILNLYSLNVRGLQGAQKTKKVFNWLQKFDKGIILLQETHTSQLDEKSWLNQWKSPIFFSHGSTNSRGVSIILPKALKENCSLHYKDSEGRILIGKFYIKTAKISKNPQLRNFYFNARKVFYSPKGC